MRLCVATLFFASTLTFPVQGLSQADAKIFSLSISAFQETVSSGRDMKLTVKLTNNSNHSITLINRGLACDYIVEVRDSTGWSPEETEEKRKLKCSDAVAGKVIVINLKPGEHYEDLIFVNNLFDMTRPDKYTVLVAREIPRELGQGLVKSNPVNITVTE
jgi:hypothetical protein